MAQDKKNAKVGQSSPPYADSTDVTANGGTAGGQVVFSGTPEEMVRHGRTITADYLRRSQ